MQLYKILSISCVFFVVEGVSPSPRDLSYSFNLSPLIRPNSNLTFVLTTRNSSPSSSFRLSFDILNRENNQTIASVNSKEIPPGSEWKEEVRLEIPGDVSLGPYALRTRSFRLNHPHPPHLEHETLHELHVDLRNSTILILGSKDAQKYVQGEWVDFSVLVLDKQRRPFRTEKNVSISIWKKSPEHFLIRRFLQVTLHPDKPLVTGQFQIPQTFYKDPETKESFQFFVTLDERSPNDPSILEGLTVPQSPQELLILQINEDSLFYSHELIEISTAFQTGYPRFGSEGVSVSVEINTPFVTLADPQVDVEVKVVNPLGFPSPSGHCEFTFSDFWDSKCFKEIKYTNNFTGGGYATRVDLSEAFDPDCLRKNVLPTQPTYKSQVSVTCTDDQFPKPEKARSRDAVALSAGNFLVSHFAVNSPDPSLLFRVTGKDSLPLGSQVTAGSSLLVTYVFQNGSQVSVDEPVIAGGFALHVLRDFVNRADLSHLTAKFNDSGPLRIDKCDGCPEKVKTQRSPAMWLTHTHPPTVPYSDVSTVRGDSVEVTVVSTFPVTHFHLKFTNRFGDKWETLEPVTPSKVSPSRFVTYANLTFPPGVAKVEFIEGDLRFYVEPAEPPPVEIDDAAKPLVRFTAPKTAGSLKVFGIIAKTHSVDQYSTSLSIHRSNSFCKISSPGGLGDPWISNCAVSGLVGPSNSRRVQSGSLADMEITGGGAEDIPVWLHSKETPQDLGDGRLWNSSSDSITTSLASGPTDVQDIVGVLIDDIHGIRLTRPATFDPKAPFALFVHRTDFSEHKKIELILFNTSNKTLANVTFFQTDLNKRIVFQGTHGDLSFTSNTTLPFDVPPFGQTRFNTSFIQHRPGVVDFRAITSHGDAKSTAKQKFILPPTPTDFIAAFDVLIDHANQTESSVNISIPLDVSQQLKHNATYRVDVSVSFNFLQNEVNRMLRDVKWGRNPNYVTISGLIPIAASLGLLTPTSQNVLKNLVTSKLRRLSADLPPAHHFPPAPLLQSLFDLYDVEPEVVDLKTRADLTKRLLQDKFPPESHLFVYSVTQNTLALRAALNRSDLIFPRNSSIQEQFPRAAEEGTERILEVASSPSASRLDILAATHLLHQLGHSSAPEFFARAAPLISQLMSEDNTPDISEVWVDTEVNAIEMSLALLIHLKRGDLKTAFTLAKRLTTLHQVDEHRNANSVQSLTAFAKATHAAEFLTSRISAHSHPTYWKEGEPLQLKINGRGFGLAQIYLSQVHPPV